MSANPSSIEATPSSIEAQYTALHASGYLVLRDVYRKADIQRIADTFDRRFQENYALGKVQSRDYRRFACKLPISLEYEPILSNPDIHALMERVLGKDYVLFNFNSHSSFPGSSHQLMHVDSVNPLNTHTFVVKEANVAFLHIPLIDMTPEHGATEVWPVTLYTGAKSAARLKVMRWVKGRTQKFNENLRQGDVVVRLDNGVHAGGANKSSVRRHLVTLIFARKHYFPLYNSGMIPCGSYEGPGMPRVPYRISSHAPLESVSTGSLYKKEDMGSPVRVPAGLGAEMEFNQYACVKRAVGEEIIERIAGGPREFIANASWTLNLVEHVLPAVRAAFRGAAFHLHSVAVNETTKEAGCDDAMFAGYAGEGVFNNADNMIRVHVPLKDGKEWIRAYPGNRPLSLSILARGSDRSCDPFQKVLASEKGALLLTTGGLVYSRLAGIPTIELTFARTGHVPSYDDRYRVTDVFALSLPRKLAKVLRYDNVFVTLPRHKDFAFSPTLYAAYIVTNYFTNLLVDHRLRGGVLLAVLAIPAAALMLPVVLLLILLLLLPIPAIRQKLHPVAYMLANR